MNIHFQALIEQKLRKDLESFGLPSPGDFKFDWSEIVGEGDEVEYLGDQLESASGLLLKNESGTIIGEGWIKHLVDASGNLYCYWPVFESNGTDYGEGPGIPLRVWRSLSEDDKYHLAATHQGWDSDAKMMPYRKKVVTELLHSHVKAVQTRLAQLETHPLPRSFDIVLFKRESEKLIDLAEKCLNGESMRYVISTEVFRFRTFLDDPKLKHIVEPLFNLDCEVRHAASTLGDHG